MKALRIPLTLLVLASSAFAEAGLFFKGAEGKPGSGKKVVLIAGDEEYRTEESCPMLGKILAKTHGFDATALFSINPEGGYVDPNAQKNIPGMDAVNDADLVIIGTRFRDLPDDQIKPLADYLNAGKPIFGFRTATHAFRGKSEVGGIKWGSFGPDILGEGWVNHYGRHRVQGARGVATKEHAKHPILNSVSDVFAESDVYGINRVNEDNADILMHAVVTDTMSPDSANTPDKKPQPGVWLRDYKTPNGKKGTALCSTMGSSCDLMNEGLRRLFINATYHLTGLDVPAKADVKLIDPLVASLFVNIREKGYYKKLNYKPADYDYGKSPATTTPMKDIVAKQAAEQAAKAPKAIPGPKINSTITSAAEQQKEGKRPKYKQPTDVTGKPAPSSKLPLNPAKGETLVFIGNSLAERMQHFGHFETLLHQTFPDTHITFRNMGFPGHTPAFRPEAGNPDPWAFPGANKFRPEIRAHHGKGHYPKPDEWLTILEADTIVAFFGFNESFDGEAGLENFRAELSAFVDHTLKSAYNGKTAPRLILATPTAMEQHKGYNLPDANERNILLAKYAQVVLEVARAKNVGAIDLFNQSLAQFQAAGDKHPTINGVHLSDTGYAQLAPVLIQNLFGKKVSLSGDTKLLRDAINDKAWFWRNDYRMLNGVHAYGQRWNPFGNINYPEEIEKIRQMTVLRDQNVWKIAQGKSSSLKVDDSKTRPLTPITTNYKPSVKNGSLNYLEEQEALKTFTLPEGFKVEVFATEKEFPNLGNPAQMRFDNQGRLWVSTVPSYPHYKPGGERPNDKLLIYEDTDGDGRADKETVFADGLHVPIGFEFAPDGVYISEEPFLTLHKDTDGDGQADSKEYILDGFDPHDTHHAISAFDVDNGGGIFMCEGRFLHSQVETPWGPQRMTDGGAWRFDPSSWKVERVFQSDVSNPWGVAHDEYGQNFLNDASGGAQYWMGGYAFKIPHGYEVPKVEKFNYEHHTRPTSGSEFLHSRHFPEEMQGDYLYANTIGFLGIKQYNVVEDGPEIKGKHRQDLIVGSDGNFRPCDLEIAPDGTLYFIDWHNTLIGHMQHSARDPKRNSQYGRIYRIVHEGSDRVEPAKVAGASLEVLFENMKLPELNSRKRSHSELRARDASEVIAAAEKFAAANAADERLQLEALWATWGHQKPSAGLLQKCLSAEDHRVRSAAVRIIRHCLHLLENPAQHLMVAAKDAHPRVRIEALSAASWLGGSAGAEVFLTVASQPTDKWIRNGLNSCALTLKVDAQQLIADGKFDKSTIPDLDKLFASKLPGAKKLKNYMTASVKKEKRKDKAFMAKYKLGEKVFHEEGSCATCHMETGLGVPKVYPPIADTPWINGDKERLAKLVLHGLTGPIEVKGEKYAGLVPMTAVGAMFNDNEVSAVLTYVRNSWGNAAEPITAEEVKAVRAATKSRKLPYTPEILMEEHPFPEGSKP